jgi:hypothetical protein
VGGEPLRGQIFNVFTLRDGRIVRIDDYRGRSERSRQPASPRMRAGADAERRSSEDERRTLVDAAWTSRLPAVPDHDSGNRA